MRKERIIGVSNAIGLISIVLLIYWVFVFIASSVFGLKVFKENITESFYFSILGILALMLGALMINVMLNLTRMADHLGQNVPKAGSNRSANIKVFIFILSFPVLLALMFAGDWLTNKNKEKYLIGAANYLVEQYPDRLKQIAAYRFDTVYLRSSEQTLRFLVKNSEEFQEIAVIVPDSVENDPVFLKIDGYSMDWDKDQGQGKISMIYSCSQSEHEYLKSVFEKGFTGSRFGSRDGTYELYYPVIVEGRIFVLYFSDYQRYGKIGS